MATAPEKAKKGRPKKYGDKFDLKDERTHGRPDDFERFENQTKKGLPITIEVSGWNDLLMRGKRDMPMDEKPCRLMQVKILKKDDALMFNRPLWIMVSGMRKNELSLKEAYEIYRRRFDIEHFFRFGKNRLLMDKCQSPETDHEDARPLTQQRQVQALGRLLRTGPRQEDPHPDRQHRQDLRPDPQDDVPEPPANPRRRHGH